MADVVAKTLPEDDRGMAPNAALEGDGDRLLEEHFKLAAHHNPGRIAVHIGYEERLCTPAYWLVAISCFIRPVSSLAG